MSSTQPSHQEKLDQTKESSLHTLPLEGGPRIWEWNSSQMKQFAYMVAAVFAVLSFFIAGLLWQNVQIRDSLQTEPTRRIQDLVTLLNQAEEKRGLLETEVGELRQKLAHLQTVADGTVKQQWQTDPEIQRLRRLAGLTEVSGPGVVVTLTDSKKSPSSANAHVDPNLGRLQADDVLKLINELKAAGAKAIAINDQRLVLTSEIVSSGSSISVNQTRLTQPVEVKVLGESKTLVNALKIRGGILEYLKFFEIQVNIQPSKQVVVPPYSGTFAASE